MDFSRGLSVSADNHCLLVAMRQILSPTAFILSWSQENATVERSDNINRVECFNMIEVYGSNYIFLGHIIESVGKCQRRTRFLHDKVRPAPRGTQ